MSSDAVTAPPVNAGAATGAVDAVQTLRERFDLALDDHDLMRRGLLVPAGRILEVLRYCRDEPSLRCATLIDITAVDYLSHPTWRGERFAVIYVLRSLDLGHVIRLKVLLEEDDPVLPTATELWPIADWLERETFDQYGIRFQGHPNPKRLLNHHQFEGHPLRKDYPVQKRQQCTVNDPMLDQLEIALRRTGHVVVDDAEGLLVRGPDGQERELFTCNFGPSHNATHGTLRLFAALDGETIVASVGEMGYLHRGFEKMVEQGTYQQVLPYTDRLNYCSSIMNNIGFCKAVEEMFGVELPERCVTLRVLLAELSRVIDHLVCVGANLVDLGALTNFWYFFNPREEVYRIWEKLCGARLTNTFTRIGGLYRDAYPGFEAEVAAVVPRIQAAIDEVRRLIERNRIFNDRTRGVGAFTPAQAIAWGWTGPCLRATGVDRDLRKDQPYYGYETYSFETVVGTTGDTYDRIMVRMLEMEESLKIVRQALARLKPGPFNCSDARLALPEKTAVYHDMEALINQFKLVYEGVRPPAGEHYSATEAANGELGYLVVSDGSGRPYRIKVRPPCLTQWASFGTLVQGHQIADALGAVLGSINIIAGELDR